MKIVSFEAPAGLRLGVVEGDQVIDLQAADAKVPTDLGALLAATNGDLSAAQGSRQARARLGAPPAQGPQVRAAGRRGPARSSASA